MEYSEENLDVMSDSPTSDVKCKEHNDTKLHKKNRPQSIDNSHESDSIETDITQRKTRDNSHESDCISYEIFSQRDESYQISREEFLNNLVQSFVQRYVNEARAKGYKIGTNESESTDENASSADEGLMDMEEDFVTKISEYLEEIVDGTDFNNEIDTMQCVDTNKDIIGEDEGICQMEGYSVETNEAIQDILQSSEENYLYEKNEKEIFIISKKGCVEDAPNVGKVAVYQISADANDYITRGYIIEEKEQDFCLITEGKETGEKPAEENLLPSMCLLVEQNNEIVKMGTGDFVDGNTFRTDKMEIDKKHVEENYLQENLPVVIQVVKGKEKIYSILYKSPWEIAYLHDEEMNISKVLCVKLSKKPGTKKLQHFKAFILAQKDGQEKVYNILDSVNNVQLKRNQKTDLVEEFDLSKKREKISARKANEGKIKKNKKNKKKNMLRIMKKLFGSSDTKNKLKIKRLPSYKEQFGIDNLVDYFIEEQISKLCSDSHRAANFEYIYKEEYNPEDYIYPKAKITCVWHETKNVKNGLVKKCANSSKKFLKHFVERKIEMKRAAKTDVSYTSKPQKAQEKEIVVPVRKKVGPLKNPKKLSVLKQVLEDLKKKKGLLTKHGILVDVFSEEIGLLSRDENVENNKHKVSKHEPMLKERKSTNSDNSSNQNLSQMHKLKNIINKVKRRIVIKREYEILNNKNDPNKICIKVKKAKPIEKAVEEIGIGQQSTRENVENNNHKVVSKHEPMLKERKSTNSDNSSNQNLSQMHELKNIINKVERRNVIKINEEYEILNKKNEPNKICIIVKKRKAAEEAREREVAMKEIGIGQQSEQPKTTVKDPKKRKVVEEAKEREEALKEIGIWQQSEQPKTAVKGRKKRKAVGEAKEREARKEIWQQSEQPKTAVKGLKRKAVGEAKEREARMEICQQSEQPKTAVKGRKKRKAVGEADEREDAFEGSLHMTERQLLKKQKEEQYKK